MEGNGTESLKKQIETENLSEFESHMFPINKRFQTIRLSRGG